MESFMKPKLDLFGECLVVAAVTYVFSSQDEVRGYAFRTLAFYYLSPLAEVSSEELVRDMDFFHSHGGEETSLTSDDFERVGTSPETEAFNDLLNEVKLNFPFETITLSERYESYLGDDGG
jgi:hypothetical protein